MGECDLFLRGLSFDEGIMVPVVDVEGLRLSVMVDDRGDEVVELLI